MLQIVRICPAEYVLPILYHNVYISIFIVCFSSCIAMNCFLIAAGNDGISVKMKQLGMCLHSLILQEKLHCLYQLITLNKSLNKIVLEAEIMHIFYGPPQNFIYLLPIFHKTPCILVNKCNKANIKLSAANGKIFVATFSAFGANCYIGEWQGRLCFSPATDLSHLTHWIK